MGVEANITGFATDSRDVKPGDLFLAIRGQNVDGHEYAVPALKSGAAAVLCEEPIPGPCFVVPDLVQSLADFGRSFRREFFGPVVGVTGSAGKTTTKELTAAALGALGPVIKNLGNHNTEYTSPLTWARLTPDTKAAVIEMGMRGFGQIAHLSSISMPTIGIITLIGNSHIEMVGSRAGIAQAKGEMLDFISEEGSALIWDEDPFGEDLRRRNRGSTYTFGFTHDADSRIVGYRALDWNRSVIRGEIDGQEWQCELPALGRHQACNAAAAVLAAAIAGADPYLAAHHMASAELPPMRMEIGSYQGAVFILDFYNASPDSTTAALRALSEVPVAGRRLAILGEMKELGESTEYGHRLVGQALAGSSVDFAYLTGGPTRFIGDEAANLGFPRERLISREQVDLEDIRAFLSEVKEGDAVLIKGSRALGLEQALPEGVVRG